MRFLISALIVFVRFSLREPLLVVGFPATNRGSSREREAVLRDAARPTVIIAQVRAPDGTTEVTRVQALLGPSTWPGR